MKGLSSTHSIAHAIHLVRGQRVMLDADLARIYGVTTNHLNEQVTKNRKRFPVDFVFRLTQQEWECLRERQKRRSSPYAFTAHGAVILAAIMGTPAAVQASVRVVQAFQAANDMQLPQLQKWLFTLHPPILAKPGLPAHRPREPRGSDRMSP